MPEPKYTNLLDNMGPLLLSERNLPMVETSFSMGGSKNIQGKFFIGSGPGKITFISLRRKSDGEFLLSHLSFLKSLQGFFSISVSNNLQKGAIF